MFRVIAQACDGLDARLVIQWGPRQATEKPSCGLVCPQMALLRRSTVAVTHAGLNTVREALETGLPMVAIPVTNDQPGIIAHVAWIGAGETISFKHVTLWKLRKAMVGVRSDPSYRATELTEQSLALGIGEAMASGSQEFTFLVAKR